MGTNSPGTGGLDRDKRIKELEEQVEELKAKLDENAGDKFTELGVSSATTASQSNYETVELSEDLSGYSSLLVAVVNTDRNALYSSLIIPMEYFFEFWSYVTTFGVSYGAQVSYMDNTHVGVKQFRNNNATANCIVIICGIK